MMNNNLALSLVIALGAATTLSACDLDVPDLNNPPIDDLRDNPTRENVLAATTGIIIGQRGNVASAHPNFIRALRHVQRPHEIPREAWNLHNDGRSGVYGADVHARAAWTITRGSPAMRVAVLDEGVDTRHPSLAPAVAAELAVVAGNPRALPDGDDAHGTACAGIIGPRDARPPWAGRVILPDWAH